MNPINFFKGYGKVGDRIEDQSFRPKTPLITIIAISVVFLLTVIIGATFISLYIHESNEDESSEELEFSNSTESIKAVCSVTQYPDSCFTAISSLNTTTKPDPELIFKLSLQVSIAETSKLSSFLKTFNGPQFDSALKDCQTLFDDALSRLNESVAAMEVGPGEKKMLTKGKIEDIKTWVSAAMTDEETCLDGLEDLESTAVIEMKSKVQRSREYLSNSLAIVANIHTLLQKFDLTLH